MRRRNIWQTDVIFTIANTVQIFARDWDANQAAQAICFLHNSIALGIHFLQWAVEWNSSESPFPYVNSCQAQRQCYKSQSCGLNSSTHEFRRSANQMGQKGWLQGKQPWQVACGKRRVTSEAALLGVGQKRTCGWKEALAESMGTWWEAEWRF